MSNPGAGPGPVPVRFGDILFVAGLIDPTGQNPKQRRVVILTPNDTLAAGYPIVAAPVITQIPPIPDPDEVLLPFSNPPGTRPPATGLTRRAGIVATWLVIVNRRDITGRSGYVPRRTMAVVQARTAAAAQTLGGWP